MERKLQETYPVEKSNPDQGRATDEIPDCCIDAGVESDPETNSSCCEQQMRWFPSPRAYLFGTLAAIAIIGIYLTMNTLTSDWYFARAQFWFYYTQ